ncbi:hypothetical protein [Parasitella parasitica]|uniref:Uncharacterized protein n=1 Tax=Parasitella parasitica TaxID=35722 RepID=A0A0B7MMY4_9FUNG|nr:hypothetical protein [Parasitella parasitica]
MKRNKKQKTSNKPTKVHEEFYKSCPDLDYESYANTNNLSKNETNIGYKSTLESLISTGSRKCKKRALEQKNLFETRKDNNSKFAKSYEDYWEKREMKSSQPSDEFSAAIHNMAKKNTLKLAETAWNTIQKETNSALDTPVITSNNSSVDHSVESAEHSNEPSNELYIEPHTELTGDDTTVLPEYIQSFFNAIKLVIGCNHPDLIDWTNQSVVEMAQEKFPVEDMDEIENLCKYDPYVYSGKCQEFIERLTNNEKSLTSFREELLKSREFDSDRFDPITHKDWSYIKIISEHFLRLMEYAKNPIEGPLRERTAASYTSQPIINHLLLPYSHSIDIKWIEVQHEWTESIKIDGTACSKINNNLLLLFEFAGGSKTNSITKFNSDVIKLYSNGIKAMQTYGSKKLYTAIYFNNKIHFEALVPFKTKYIRYKYSTIKCPTNSNELKQFIANLNPAFAWSRDIGESV